MIDEYIREGQIEYCPFVVDETPYCIWDVNLQQRNLEFINSIDAGYFAHVADLHVSTLDSEQRQYAAVALRTEYYHSLEAFFALLCATVQAPNCVIGWMLKYQNRELFSAVRKINNRQPILSRLDMEHVTWAALAAEINQFTTKDAQKDNQLRQSFGILWRRFAKDFLDEDITNEYNSIKHGLRVSMGGFTLAMGLETTPGTPAPPEAMRSLGGSTYGSSFFVAKQLQNRDNFQAMRHSLNWRPENLAHALSLVSMSIQNVLSYLKLINGSQQANTSFVIPANETDFDKPWEALPGINKFSVNNNIDESSISILSKPDILASFEAVPFQEVQDNGSKDKS